MNLPEKLECIGENCFAESALKSIKFFSGLKIIRENAFNKCVNLESAYFSEGLEQIGSFAFFESGLRHAEFPASLRMVAQGAFACCGNLSTACFRDGLEVLGTDEYTDDGNQFYGVFSESALE